MSLSRFHTELKLKNCLRHYKHHVCQSVETVSGENAIVRFKNSQMSLLQSDKVGLDIKAKLMDVCEPSNSNCVKEHETIAVSFFHG